MFVVQTIWKRDSLHTPLASMKLLTGLTWTGLVLLIFLGQMDVQRPRCLAQQILQKLGSAHADDGFGYNGKKMSHNFVDSCAKSCQAVLPGTGWLQSPPLSLTVKCHILAASGNSLK